ncbi:MAG: hypothetical protein EZS28_053210, partial [Streblomastix strix]
IVKAACSFFSEIGEEEDKEVVQLIELNLNRIIPLLVWRLRLEVDDLCEYTDAIMQDDEGIQDTENQVIGLGIGSNNIGHQITGMNQNKQQQHQQQQQDEDDDDEDFEVEDIEDGGVENGQDEFERMQESGQWTSRKNSGTALGILLEVHKQKALQPLMESMEQIIQMSVSEDQQGVSEDERWIRRESGIVALGLAAQYCPYEVGQMNIEPIVLWLIKESQDNQHTLVRLRSIWALGRLSKWI